MKKVKYKELNWWVLKEDENGKLLFLEERLRPEVIDKYFMHDSDYDVKFNYDYKNPWWRDSYIRHVLNSSFLKELDIEELNTMEITVELNEEKVTTKDYVRLLTKEEAEALDVEIRKTNDQYGYWLMTPYNWYGSLAYEFIVGGSSYTGRLGNNYVYSASGVRPVIFLKSDAQVTELTFDIESNLAREETLEEIDLTSDITKKVLAQKVNAIIRKLKEGESDE